MATPGEMQGDVLSRLPPCRDRGLFRACELVMALRRSSLVVLGLIMQRET